MTPASPGDKIIVSKINNFTLSFCGRNTKHTTLNTAYTKKNQTNSPLATLMVTPIRASLRASELKASSRPVPSYCGEKYDKIEFMVKSYQTYHVERQSAFTSIICRATTTS